MKVLVFSSVFPNPQQPVHGLFVFERIRHAARLADVQVLAPVPWFRRGDVPVHESRDGLIVHHPTAFYVPRILKSLDGSLFFASVLPTVRRIRQTFDFDLIDSHFAYPDGVAAVLLGRWTGRPVVITLRGSEAEFVKSTLRRAAIRWALRSADRIIAVSHPLAELARELGVPSERVRVIANGVDIKRFAPLDRTQARKSLGLDVDAEVVVSVGHMVPRKGFHRLLPAFARLRLERPRLQLVIVGGTTRFDTAYETEVRGLISTLGLDQAVRLTGATPPDRVSQWLNTGDVFALASAHEGCPNAVWEALACGVPVVVSRVGEVERMVPSFAGIIYDDPCDLDALEQSLGKALSADWDHAKIRQYAEQHTWEGVAEQVVQEWKAVVAAPRSRAAMR
jgi:teichuronic acid biosynthesis glycosyltransferase TuaC